MKKVNIFAVNEKNADTEVCIFSSFLSVVPDEWDISLFLKGLLRALSAEKGGKMEVVHVNSGLSPKTPLDPGDQEAGMWRCSACSLPVWQGSGVAGLHQNGCCPYCGQQQE